MSSQKHVQTIGSEPEDPDKDKYNIKWWLQRVVGPILALLFIVVCIIKVRTMYTTTEAATAKKEEEMKKAKEEQEKSNKLDIIPTQTIDTKSEDYTKFITIVKGITTNYKHLVAEGNSMTYNEIQDLNKKSGLSEKDKDNELNEINASGELRISTLVDKRNNEISEESKNFTSEAVYKACVELAKSGLLLFNPIHNPNAIEEKDIDTLSANDKTVSNVNNSVVTPVTTTTTSNTNVNINSSDGDETKNENEVNSTLPGNIDQKMSDSKDNNDSYTLDSEDNTTKESYTQDFNKCRNPMKEYRDISDERDIFAYTTFDYLGVQNPNYWSDMDAGSGNLYDEELSKNLFKYKMDCIM